VVSFWLVAALAIVGCFTAAARRIPRAFWILPFLLWLSVAPVTTGTPRFRSALEPFVIMLAALGVQAIVAALVRGRKRARVSDAGPPIGSHRGIPAVEPG
jgi:hypothetical protein